MTMSKEPEFDTSDWAQVGANWAALAEKSQRIVQAFAERQAEDGGFSIVDTQSVNRAFLEMMTKMAADPFRLADAQVQFWQDSARLWQSMALRMQGQSAESVAEPNAGDRRFKDPAWNDELVFDYIKQSYLLSSRWMESVVGDVRGLDPQDKEKVEFYTRQFLSALSPSNFAMTNPAVLKKTTESGGENLVKGLEHLLEDLEKGKGRLKISMTDESAFEVGKNVAASPGKVVFQNELMQLIQYDPTTEKVHKRPMLFVPPWINKFYVMDLQPKNSLIKWTVDQGHTLFVISWVNPRKELAHKDFQDYMREGPLAALDAIEQATGEREVNALGFCIGGILMVATLAYMAAVGDKRINSATLLATMVDLQDVGEVSVFIDETQLESLEQHVGEKGYLEGHHMAEMFNMMRENDLIWSFVVNNYLMGRDPMPFDLLYWNADSTRLPATMLVTYLRKVYRDNGLMHPAHLVLDDVPIDIGKIETPCYMLATKDDHIAPWISSYPATQSFGGSVRFVLGASGHIAGVINPPAANKYCYWTNAKSPADAEAWFEDAERHDGSWWADWGKWLARKGGAKVPARKPGDGKLKPIEDAPGAYVKVRISE
ncbi:alpha/beta hydrolase [Pelagibius sp.]|uniref:PHA/PHB synthase family protein n=1 Tax=Pelagibius sp. TaxID=1931238 RepID=UPI0026051B42|nr:class I poly(R)-hydroxyalkanoic acid synthase [Pelagibius sp.]